MVAAMVAGGSARRQVEALSDGNGFAIETDVKCLPLAGDALDELAAPGLATLLSKEIRP